MAVDLHIHSTASDGTVPPGDLPALAAAAGLKAIALTDHDTVDGLPEFLAKQNDFPDLELISGVELSSRCGAREVHIVGLYIDWNNDILQDFMRKMRDERLLRAELMQKKLHALGYEVTWDDLLAVGMSANVPGRPHFAEVLVKKYNFPDNKTVFERLLKHGAPGYVPRSLPLPAEAIKAVKAAGGVAVWAHPFSSKYNITNHIRKMLPELKIAGLDALEAYYSEYTPGKSDLALRIAKEYSLAVSGGSDFHGLIHPDVSLGSGRGNLMVPDEVLDSLKRAGEPKVVIM